MTILLFFIVYQMQSSKQNRHPLQSIDVKSFLLNAFQVFMDFMQIGAFMIACLRLF